MHVFVTFFLMWNRVKYAIKIFKADKHATSNFPPKNALLIVRSTQHQEGTSGEKYVTSGKIVRDTRTHECTHTNTHTHTLTHT